jgi:hypothetical protein
MKVDTLSNTLIGDGTFELIYGTATSRTSATTGTMEKRQSTRALQQRV